MAQTKSMSLVSFLVNKGVVNDPQPVITKDNRIAYVAEDAYGNELWIAQPKAHPEHLTLVSFSQPLTTEGRKAFAKQVEDNMDNLSIVISHKETSAGVYDGKEIYTLVDTDKIGGEQIKSNKLMAAVKAAQAAQTPAMNDGAPF